MAHVRDRIIPGLRALIADFLGQREDILQAIDRYLGLPQEP